MTCTTLTLPKGISNFPHGRTPGNVRTLCTGVLNFTWTPDTQPGLANAYNSQKIKARHPGTQKLVTSPRMLIRTECKVYFICFSFCFYLLLFKQHGLVHNEDRTRPSSVAFSARRDNEQDLRCRGFHTNVRTFS